MPRPGTPELRSLTSLRGQTPRWMISSFVSSIIQSLVVGLVVMHELLICKELQFYKRLSQHTKRIHDGTIIRVSLEWGISGAKCITRT